MIVDNREAGGCSYQGSESDCKTGKNLDGSHTDMVNNDDAAMRKEVKSVAKSQQKIKEFFDKEEGRMKRFVAIDLCGARPSSTLTRLMWISRSNLGEHSVSKLMTVHHDFSAETTKHYHTLAKDSALSLSKQNSNDHPERSKKKVREFLEKVGCYKEHKDDLWYSGCVEKMEALEALEAAGNSSAH